MDAPKMNTHLNFENFQKNPAELKITYGEKVCCQGITSFTAYKLDDGKAEAAIVENGSDYKRIKILSLEENKIKTTLETGHTEWIKNIKHYYNQNNKIHYLISASDDNTIKVFNINNSYERIFSISANTVAYSLAMLFKDNNYFVLGCYFTEKLKVWNSSGTQTETLSCEYKKNYDTEVYYIGNDIFLLIMGAHGVRIFDFNKKILKKEYVDPNGDGFVLHRAALIYSNGGNLELIEGDDNGCIRRWDLEKGDLLGKIQQEGEDPWISTTCLWNETLLITGGGNENIMIYDLKAEKLLKELTGHSYSILTIEKVNISGKGECLVSMDNDNNLKVWAA